MISEQQQHYVPWPRCPDDGRCWHRCEERCWRIDTCAPLGMDDWPEEIKRQEHEAITWVGRTPYPYGTVILGGGSMHQETADVVSTPVVDKFTTFKAIGAWVSNPTTGETLYLDFRDYANGNPNEW